MGAEDKVTGIIDDLKGWATEVLASAQSALANLGNVSISTVYGGGYNVGDIYTTDPIIIPTPAKPVLSAAPDIVPIDLSKTKPIKPPVSYPTLGELIDINLPDVPPINFPSLDITPPVYDVVSPETWTFSVDNFAIVTNDPLEQAVVKKLLDMVRNGGTGISEDVENAIWDRELERNEQQLEDSLDKTRTAWAKTGFSLPDGMLANSIAELQKEYMNKRLDTAREIAIKQAELEQQNLFKSLELSIQAYSKIYELLMSYEEMVFKSQEATAKFANEYIDLQLKAYQSKVEAYKAQAATYEMIIRAEMSKVELYKAQLEGQKLIGEINSQTIEVYTSTLKAIEVMMDVYKTEVGAYAAELEADKTMLEANKLQFDIWAEKTRTALQAYNGDIEVYKAGSMVNISIADLKSKNSEAKARIALSNAQINTQNMQAIIQGLHSAENIKMQAAKGVADASASLAAGAMAALTARASMSYEESKTIED